MKIPVIHVIYDEDKLIEPGFRADIVTSPYLDPKDDGTFNRLTFNKRFFEHGDGLYIKTEISALTLKSETNETALIPSPLKRRLDELGTKLIVLSGMETSVCLGTTAWAAEELDLDKLIACDVAADTNYRQHEMRPQWHQEMLRNFVNDVSSLRMQSEILALINDGGCRLPPINEKPAPPQKQAPVVYEPRKLFF